MKIAFATTDGKMVDEHFGRAGMFFIYEVTELGSQFIAARKFADGADQAIVGTRNKGQEHEDAVRDKVEQLADCKLIYLTEIGGPSAARLVKKGIMPMKVKSETSIETALGQLLDTIRQSPPPWLKKALKADSE